jgi:ribosome recycling factor
LPTTTTTPYTCPANQVAGDLSKSSAASSATVYEIVNNVKNNIGSSIYVGNNGFTPSQSGSSIYIDMPTTASSYVS